MQYVCPYFTRKFTFTSDFDRPHILQTVEKSLRNKTKAFCFFWGLPHRIYNLLWLIAYNIITCCGLYCIEYNNLLWLTEQNIITCCGLYRIEYNNLLWLTAQNIITCCGLDRIEYNKLLCMADRTVPEITRKQGRPNKKFIYAWDSADDQTQTGLTSRQQRRCTIFPALYTGSWSTVDA